AEAERRARVGIVGRGHAQIHDGVALLPRQLLLLPHVVEEALDAGVVEALRQALAARLAARVVGAGLALRHAVLGELVERVWPVVPVNEGELRGAPIGGR